MSRLEDAVAEPGVRSPGVSSGAPQAGLAFKHFGAGHLGITEPGTGAEMALRLGKLCGNGPECWLRMQMARDLWHLERTLRADLARIPTHRAA